MARAGQQQSRLVHKDGVTLPLRERREVAVLVAGGGVAGVYAALGAADHGRGVLLVEQHAFVGGQGTAGGVHTFCGETRFVNDRWREMLRRLHTFGGISAYRANADGRAFDCESQKFVLQEMLAEAGVELLLHTQVLAVERSGDRLAAVILANKSGLTRIEPEIAIDATGDADLVARGGWPIRKGGPVLIPGDPPAVDEAAGKLQLPMSLYFTLVDTGAPVTPVQPPGCPVFSDDNEVPMITVIPHGHHVTVKMKVIGHDATDGASLSAAEQAGRRQMMGVVHYLQAHGYGGTRYPNHRLAWVAPTSGCARADGWRPSTASRRTTSSSGATSPTRWPWAPTTPTTIGPRWCSVPAPASRCSARHTTFRYAPCARGEPQTCWCRAAV